VGAERHHEDSHKRSNTTPKLRLVGQIHARCDGRPLKILARETEISIQMQIRTLVHLYWSAKNLRPLQLAIERSGMKLMLDLGWLGSWRLA